MSELTEQDLNQQQSDAARMNGLSTNKSNRPSYSTASPKAYTQIDGPKLSKSKPMAIVDGVGRTRGEVHRPLETRNHPIHLCTTPHDNLAVNGHHQLSSNHTNESYSEPNSLNESSSVEVLSEIDDEAKFENSLATFNQFEN